MPYTCISSNAPTTTVMKKIGFRQVQRIAMVGVLVFCSTLAEKAVAGHVMDWVGRKHNFPSFLTSSFRERSKIVMQSSGKKLNCSSQTTRRFCLTCFLNADVDPDRLFGKTNLHQSESFTRR